MSIRAGIDRIKSFIKPTRDDNTEVIRLLHEIAIQLIIMTKILVDIDGKFPSAPSKMVITFDKPTQQ